MSAPFGLLSKVWPDPLHDSHIEEVCILPRIVLVILVTWPLPLHVAHLLKVDPGAFTFLFTLIFLSTPLEISSNVRLTLTRKLLPLITLCPPNPPPNPPPNALPKISPNWLKMSSMFIPPLNPAPPFWKAWCPNWSYLAFLLGLLNTSYASAASLNFSSAALSFGFLSGWYWIAIFL